MLFLQIFYKNFTRVLSYICDCPVPHSYTYLSFSTHRYKISLFRKRIPLCSKRNDIFYPFSSACCFSFSALFPEYFRNMQPGMLLILLYPSICPRHFLNPGFPPQSLIPGLRHLLNPKIPTSRRNAVFFCQIFSNYMLCGVVFCVIMKYEDLV